LNPVYFGTGERRLFGLYTPAQAAASGGRSIVLCHPWGQEYLRAHRSMRRLATMLAGSGFHVFRFDYYGTGDSDGDATSGDLSGWTDDIESAIAELRDTTGASRVVLAGIRLGGALAASVAARNPRLVESLILWDPVLSGPEYLSELARDAAPYPERGARLSHRRVHVDGEWEVRGFPVTERLARDIETVDVIRLTADLPEKTFIISSHGQPSHVLLKSALSSHNHPAIMEEVVGAPAWLEERDLGAGVIPVKVLHRIVSWLT
jgi:uncharacterized protein